MDEASASAPSRCHPASALIRVHRFKMPAGVPVRLMREARRHFALSDAMLSARSPLPALPPLSIFDIAAR